MSNFKCARALLRGFKGDAYAFGANVLVHSGPMAAQLGQRAAVICGRSAASRRVSEEVVAHLRSAGVTVVGELSGARPNAPREDVACLADGLRELAPEVILVIGGGSAIDAAKAAEVLHTLGDSIENYFGTGRVSQVLSASGSTLTPLLAVQMAASSGAHLTRYSNVTDLASGQKKLIVDQAIVPTRSIFQYDVTTSMSHDLTLNGAFDGIAHCLEVFFAAVGSESYQRVKVVATEGIRLIVQYVERTVADPEDLEAREALGLGTDLGGYAIMLGGTSGAHLTSFSLVDVLSHGRACAIMNPYYTVFFAPAIEEPLRAVGQIYRQAGLTDANLDALSGRELGVAVAEAMIALSKRLGFPTTLGEVEGFTDAHIERALTAARDPQLKMKLENMPVPLTAEMIDKYMAPVLEAARDGALRHVKNVP